MEIRSQEAEGLILAVFHMSAPSDLSFSGGTCSDPFNTSTSVTRLPWAVHLHNTPPSSQVRSSVISHGAWRLSSNITLHTDNEHRLPTSDCISRYRRRSPTCLPLLEPISQRKSSAAGILSPKWFSGSPWGYLCLFFTEGMRSTLVVRLSWEASQVIVLAESLA